MQTLAEHPEVVDQHEVVHHQMERNAPGLQEKAKEFNGFDGRWQGYGAYWILGYLIGLLDNQAIPEYPGDAGAGERAKEMHVYPDPGATQGSVGYSISISIVR